MLIVQKISMFNLVKQIAQVSAKNSTAKYFRIVMSKLSMRMNRTKSLLAQTLKMRNSNRYKMSFMWVSDKILRLGKSLESLLRSHH